MSLLEAKILGMFGTKESKYPLAPQLIQKRLLFLAGGFLFTFSVILTLAPAARARTWQVDFNFSHWIGFTTWCLAATLLHHQVRRRLPEVDPYLLPLAALLAGWGMLTIWRLLPSFGLRQAAWLLLSCLVTAFGLRLPSDLRHLRRYKYIFLSAGILLTALTLLFGTSPGAGGLNLWLGCCGFYFQPSEPLKLLFLVYLAAYLADRLPLQLRFAPLITPTLIVTGLALLLLIVQRDLGTASIFFFLYTITLYIAYGRKRVLLISLAGVAIAGIIGYYLFDVVQLRVDAWINPWLDPSGRSFQVVQSLMAIANGGIGGRGPGMGSPGLVPVAISDFIYTAIAEETGLAGALGLLTVMALLITRGILVALRAPDTFRRFLAAGLSAYLAIQSILIIGGNTRLLPLTGVTLPFVSYGGSSLLTSFLALLLLLHASNQVEKDAAPLPKVQPLRVSTGLLLLGFLALALTTGWWAVWRGPTLLERTDNARRAIADRYVRRGTIYDRNEKPLNFSAGTSGTYTRVYAYPDLSAVVGYTHANYGLSGLEASLDSYLRGLRGNPASLIWIDHLLYGQPPPGLDLRLSLDLRLQARADALLGSLKGAVVLLDARSGEILVMASHPVYDANLLDEIAPALLADPESSLLNRAAQAAYPPGMALEPFLSAASSSDTLSPAEQEGLYQRLGFFEPPAAFLPAADASVPGSALRVSPLQMALAAATLSAGGQRPAPTLVTAVRIRAEGWVIFPKTFDPVPVFSADEASRTASQYTQTGAPFWLHTATAGSLREPFTWSMGGTLPDWQGVPVVVVVLLERDYPAYAAHIASALLQATITP